MDDEEDVLDLDEGSSEESTGGSSRSPRKLLILLTLVVSAVLIAIIIAHNSVVKKVSPSGAGSSGVVTDTNSTSPNTNGASTNPTMGASTVAAPQGTASVTQSTATQPAGLQKIITESDNPKLTGSFNGAGLLDKKLIYLNGREYIFDFVIDISNGKASVPVDYFTTKKDFDTYKVGTVFKITYTGDSTGNLAIESISK